MTERPEPAAPRAVVPLEYGRDDSGAEPDGWRFALRAAIWAGMAAGLFALVSGFADLQRMILSTN